MMGLLGRWGRWSEGRDTDQDTDWHGLFEGDILVGGVCYEFCLCLAAPR